MLGYYDRIDQVRGIAPIASGLNSLRDTYENFDFALAKAKLSQILGVQVTRNAVDAMGNLVKGATGGDTGRQNYKIDIGRGPAWFDLDPGEEVKLLESQTPSTQFQAFMTGIIQVALKALDIPFSFFDESHTNFFGSRGAWLHYKRACDSKRERLMEFLDWWTLWQLQLAVLDGELQLPGRMTVADLAWEWVPTGMPWWDPSKEINGQIQAVGAGFDNPERICKEAGTDVYENIDATERVKNYAKDRGIVLSFNAIAQPIVVKEADDA
ncbi:MAG: phage portal protein [Pirellulales bacterium]